MGLSALNYGIVGGYGEFTAAVLLIVEVVLLQKLVATLLKATLTPVLSPEDYAGRCHRCSCIDQLFCLVAGALYLLQALPTAGSQCGSKIFDAKFLGLLGCLDESQGKALFTAAASLRLALQSTDPLSPAFVIVVTINPPEPQTLCMTLALLLADFVFLARIDIGIVIKNGRAYIVLHQPLDDGR